MLKAAPASMCRSHRTARWSIVRGTRLMRRTNGDRPLRALPLWALHDLLQSLHPIDRLIEQFAPNHRNLVAVPVSAGRRCNPVLWSRRFFQELMTLDGDIGARHLIARHGEGVAEVPVEGFGAFLDIDTPQALEAAQRG